MWRVAGTSEFAKMEETKDDESVNSASFIHQSFCSWIPDRDCTLRWLKSRAKWTNLSSSLSPQMSWKDASRKTNRVVYLFMQFRKFLKMFTDASGCSVDKCHTEERKNSFLITNNKWFLFWLFCACLRSLPRFQPSRLPYVEWNVHSPKNWVIKCERVEGKILVPCWRSTKLNP